MMRLTALTAAAIAVCTVAGGVVAALSEPPVYGPPLFFEAVREIDPDGDRIRLSATVLKLRDCDLEGPAWVDYYDAAGRSTPPPGAMFRPDGTPAGRTLGGVGDSIRIEGYTMTVPDGLRDQAGTAVVRAPCRLWTPTEGGGRDWGRRIVGSWGPIPVPPPGRTIRDFVVLAR